MAIPNNYKCEIGIEAAFGDGLGGGAFTPIPLTFDSIPKIRKTDTTLPVIGGSKARQKSYPDEKFYEIPVKFFLKGVDTSSPSAGTAPELGKLFRAFGFDENISASTYVAYDPQDSGYESATLRINTDGVRYVCAGAKGVSMKIPFIAGKRVQCEGTMRSLYAAPTEVSYSAPTFADVLADVPIVESIALTIAGNTHVIPEITFSFDNSVEIEPNVNAANGGIEDWAYGDRNWTVELFIKRDAANDIEFWTAHDASTELAFASTGFGPTSGGHIEFDASNIQLTDIEEVTRVGQIYYRITGGINYNATLANQFRLKFT